MLINTGFDFRDDASDDDPDRSSPTLRRYHQLLWSKPLPNGHAFDLDITTKGEYLHHNSEVGEFFLSSDSVIATFSYWQSTADLIRQVPKADVESFDSVGYTIGGMMVFPSNMVDGQWTLNMARGMNGKIADRMDLTLECIRRHYSGLPSELGVVLSRYATFFDLFDDFNGYVNFFLLQDLLAEDGTVRFFMPFDDFTTPAVPGDPKTYLEYRRRSIDFVRARNVRIDQWARENLTDKPPEDHRHG